MPDTWITPRIWVAGEKYTASKANDISNNFRSLFPYTAGGDLAYRDPAGAYLSRLAPPVGLSLLQHSGSVPSWLAIGAALKFLRVNAAGNALEWAGGGVSFTYHNNGTGHSYSTNLWRDMPNSSKSITVSVQSTIFCIGFVNKYASDSPNYYGFFHGLFNIDGTDAAWGGCYDTYGTAQKNTMILGSKSGVAAGSRTIKLREICDAGAYTVERLAYGILIIPD